jgi:hypothetical protein
MAGFLYASIGFFWLCTILSVFFFCYIPLAYFFIGDSRKLISRRAIPDVIDNSSVLTVTAEDASKAKQ